MKQRGETLFVAALVVFSAAALWESYGIAGFSKWSSPGVFPMLASATMLVCAIFIFRDARKRNCDTFSQESIHDKNEIDVTAIGSTGSTDSPLPDESTAVLPTRVIIVTALLALYVAAMPTLGFLLCSGLFLFIGISYLWEKPLWIALCTSLFSLIVIHFVFRRVFQVVLPEGTLINWLF